jgi:hypothetical protein
MLFSLNYFIYSLGLDILHILRKQSALDNLNLDNSNPRYIEKSPGKNLSESKKKLVEIGIDGIPA